jgi:hypothetical protein
MFFSHRPVKCLRGNTSKICCLENDFTFPADLELDTHYSLCVHFLDFIVLPLSFSFLQREHGKWKLSLREVLIEPHTFAHRLSSQPHLF